MSRDPVHLCFAIALAVIVAACASTPRPNAPPRVGFATVSIADPQDKPIETAIWYPTDAAPSPIDLGLSRQSLAPQGRVIGEGLPLVVISHGNGGGFASHADTAYALAAAGFVVAAPNHTGDNFRDDSYVGTARWLTERPRHVKRVVDYMLGEWPERARLDGRVGVFGFSAGAFTALVVIGGVPDLIRMADHCRKAPELACSLWKESPVTSPARESWTHDRRVSAAVVAAAGLGFAFEPDGLAHLSAPVQLWSAGDDRVVPYATNTALVRAQLNGAAEYHDVPQAGHMSFITPCSPRLAPPLCQDAEGFDRAAFHDELNRAVVAYFLAHLEKR